MKKNTDFYNKESIVYSQKRYPKLANSFTTFFFKKKLAIVIDYLCDIPKKEDLSFLEIGCADGVVIKNVLEQNLLFKRVSGVDVSPKMIEVANKGEYKQNVFFSVRDDKKITTEDIIVEVGVLNLIDYKKEFSFVYEHLNPNGYYICTVSSKESLLNFFKRTKQLLHLNWRCDYEREMKKYFETIKISPVGLFIPFLWKFGKLSLYLQLFFDKVFRFLPSFYHERVYFLKKKSV